jgi:hypothetical protein
MHHVRAAAAVHTVRTVAASSRCDATARSWRRNVPVAQQCGAAPSHATAVPRWTRRLNDHVSAIAQLAARQRQLQRAAGKVCTSIGAGCTATARTPARHDDGRGAHAAAACVDSAVNVRTRSAHRQANWQNVRTGRARVAWKSSTTYGVLQGTLGATERGEASAHTNHYPPFPLIIQDHTRSALSYKM